MLRKNKMMILGRNSNNDMVYMESNNIFRNFDPEHYMQIIMSEIHNSDVPDFETSCAYNFGDKVVKFLDTDFDNISNNELGYVITKVDLYDYIYFVNTSDVFTKLDISGDCISDTLRVKKLNLAPRSIMVLKLDRAELFNVEEEEGKKKKVFYKNTSDLDFNLEYNIYMTRLL
jgi:hypothetical protein